MGPYRHHGITGYINPSLEIVLLLCVLQWDVIYVRYYNEVELQVFYYVGYNYQAEHLIFSGSPDNNINQEVRVGSLLAIIKQEK